MSTRCSILAVGACACLAAAPREPHVEPAATVTERVALGASVDMETTAIAGCRTESWVTGVELTWDNPEKEGPDLGLRRGRAVVGCRGQALEAKVFCRPRTGCEMADDDEQGYGGLSIPVLLVEPGTTEVTLEINNLEAGTHSTTVRRFEVLPPTAFRLQCLTPARLWGSCEEGVAAAQPLIRIWPMLDGKLVRTRLLRVNGHAGTSSTSFVTGQSLEPIVGISPMPTGTYELEIAVGALRERAIITAY